MYDHVGSSFDCGDMAATESEDRQVSVNSSAASVYRDLLHHTTHKSMRTHNGEN